MTRPNIDTPPDEPEPPTSMTSPPTPDIASPEPPKSTLEDVDYIRIATQHKRLKRSRQRRGCFDEPPVPPPLGAELMPVDDRESRDPDVVNADGGRVPRQRLDIGRAATGR